MKKETILKKRDWKLASKMVKSSGHLLSISKNVRKLRSHQHHQTSTHPALDRSRTTPLWNNWPAPEKSHSVTVIWLHRKTVVCVQSLCGLSSINLFLLSPFVWLLYSHFISLMVAAYKVHIFHPFISNLFVSLNLNCVSCVSI